jgi:hypothetical protein
VRCCALSWRYKGAALTLIVSKNVLSALCRQNAESLIENGVIEIRVSRFESVDPIWEEASCTCIASRMALDSGESSVALGDNGGTMFGSRAS